MKLACSALVVTSLAVPAIAAAQTGWPSATARTKPSHEKKAEPRKAIAAIRPVGAKKAVEPRTPAVSDRDALLRSMGDLLTRQSTAIEALAARLQDAERRLATIESTLIAAPFEPVRAGLAIDWSQVFADTRR